MPRTRSSKKVTAKPIPVRLDEATLQRLKRAAEKTGESEATILRLVLRAGLTELEARAYELFTFLVPKEEGGRTGGSRYLATSAAARRAMLNEPKQLPKE